MKTRSPHRSWARLAALACATTLATALGASVTLQRSTGALAHAAQVPASARLDARLASAIDEAYLDGDLELADSLERICASRAAALCHDLAQDVP